MSYRIEVAPEFARRLKKLSQRYKSIKQDYEVFLHSLQSNPLQGVDLGKGLRKIRMSIASKGKGKVAVKGESLISAVKRPQSPPLLLDRLLRIQEVALPQTTSMILSLPLHQPFLKFSKAGRNPERGVSIHGSSSMNMTCRSPLFWPCSNCSSKKNASIQDFGIL